MSDDGPLTEADFDRLRADAASCRGSAPAARHETHPPSDFPAGPWVAKDSRVLDADGNELFLVRNVSRWHHDLAAAWVVEVVNQALAATSGDLAPGEPSLPPADRVETAARVLHERRHRAGYSHVCDACRGDARAVAAALVGGGRPANAAALLARCDEVEADTMGRHGHGGHVLPAVLSTSVIRALLSTGEAS